jgi:putative Mg2+ transporter-C (MgtC) family protein
MSLNIGWAEIALRLALTVAAGILIGISRSEHGHAAGLRTTLLVCLAAFCIWYSLAELLKFAKQRRTGCQNRGTKLRRAESL